MRPLTTEEAATLAGVQPVTVRQWVVRGRLEPLRRGAKPLLFRESDVVEAAHLSLTRAQRARLDTLAERWLASG